jgi:D-alanyl-D-alanine carboxypeptidase/D-alanyl-D-alanine-endopeptidase (penicillin-binding protein 4)
MHIVLLICASAAALLQAQDFPSAAQAIFASPPFSSATVGALFVSVSDGTTFYSRNPGLPLMPASTAKLATSAAALARLKPGFRFATTFLADPKELGRTKLSVLVWRGTGDPSISGRNHSSLEDVFDIWADSLTALGVNKIKRLVLDTRYFEGPATAPVWPEDELAYWYEAETSAISFNDNCVNLGFLPAAKAGRRPRILLLPDYGYIKVKNRAKTGPSGSPFTLDYRRQHDANKVEFFGSIPAGAARHDFVSVHDPALFAAETLKRVWKKKGIKVSKILFWEKAGLKEERLSPILVWESEPLAELAKIVNKNSQNFYAEQILKALGKEGAGKGSFSGGLSVVGRFLSEAGLTEAQFHLEDGSGLSEEDRFTAAGLVGLLKYMSATPYFSVYYDSLAVPGVDRAAKDRMKGDPLAAGMRLKRGTVGHARNLAGYLKSTSGKLYAFAMLVNGPRLDRHAVDEALDRVCLAAAHGLP